jgi:hypothetical protein
VERLDAEHVGRTAGCFLKHQEDIERLRGGLAQQLLEALGAG